MPGMTSGVGVNNQLITEAFRAALRHQLLIAAVIFMLLWVLRLIAIIRQPAGDATGPGGPPGGGRPLAGPEPAGRQLLRIGFGILWIFDGILQAQPAMPGGLTAKVIEPSAASSPGWVRHLVNWAGTAWTYHPVTISAAVVWIQVGIGMWLLFAKRGAWSRLGGLAGLGWGLVVWVFGEAFGGILAPGLTWLFGAPGAALLYCVAGALLALPESAWHGRRLGRLLLAGTGAFFAGMAVLQAWPGRGFWQGTIRGRPGTLTGMVRSMGQTPQPHYLARIVNSFAGFVAAHGFAVNLFAVIALAATGVAFLSGRPALARVGVAAGIVLCLADWLLIEDLGFLGGLGTDPNSMIPIILLFVSGYLALTRPAAQPAAVGEPLASETTASSSPGRGQLRRPAALLQSGLRSIAGASARSVAAAGALGVVLLGVVPSAAASANRQAAPIIAEAIDGSSQAVSYPAAGFTLTDQHGRTVSLASLRGRVVLLTFLDPVCTNDCPLIGREFAAAGHLLAADARRVTLAAVVVSPTYRSVAAMQAFDRQEGLGTLPNWLFLTGTLAQLQKVWDDYQVAALTLPAGGMTAHSDIAYVINARGQVRRRLDMDPGAGTPAAQSSFAVQLADAARQSLG